MQLTSPWFSMTFCRPHTGSPLYLGYLLLILLVPKFLVAKSCMQQYAFAQCLLTRQRVPAAAVSCFDLRGYQLGLLQENTETQTPVLLIPYHQRTAFLSKRQQLLPLLAGLTPLCHKLFLNLYRRVSRGATAVVGQGGLH